MKIIVCVFVLLIVAVIQPSQATFDKLGLLSGIGNVGYGGGAVPYTGGYSGYNFGSAYPYPYSYGGYGGDQVTKVIKVSVIPTTYGSYGGGYGGYSGGYGYGSGLGGGIIGGGIIGGGIPATYGYGQGYNGGFGLGYGSSALGGWC